MVYCGNNRIHAENKKLHIGTRYQCLRKGIAVGKNSEISNDYEEKYAPIEEILFFCGNGDAAPPEYDRLGTRSECFSKGFGRGRQITYDNYSARKICAAILKTGPRKGERCRAPAIRGPFCARHD
jgi:hypothetical protein